MISDMASCSTDKSTLEGNVFGERAWCQGECFLSQCQRKFKGWDPDLFLSNSVFMEKLGWFGSSVW